MTFPPPPPWASELTTLAVTGTNGKTSTTTYLAAALSELGDPVAWLTTVGAGIGDPRSDLHRPFVSTHAGFLALMDELRLAGGRHAALEVTSAALARGFARAWPCSIAVFTNLGHDHMRTHGTPEHYLASKAQLFVHLPPGGVAVLHAGDPNAALIAEIVPDHARICWFAGPDQALDHAVDLRVRVATPSWSGLELVCEAPEFGLIPAIRLHSAARIQADNAAAALLAALVAGVPADRAALALSECPPPPGRFEIVSREGCPRVVVDYAHDPDALRTLLADARRLTRGSLVLVFGAGGDTDANKRAPMGAAASAADRVILTSDNPRNEDPAAIVAALREGLPLDHPCEVELDRPRAIAHAIADAELEDLVVVSGKGHEHVQIIGSRAEPCSDREIAAECLATWRAPRCRI
jgi:UDP-N-acetylmuramoyl-L-alanyl-D-glutamate--2,6-diaminopimelate ligase